MKKNVLSLCLLFMAIMPSFAQHYVGGDISMLPLYEQKGAKYYTNSGTAITDVLGYFKSEGLNTMRVRLFVDPSQATQDEKNQGVRQDLEYVKSLGKRIKDYGLKFMLDFHYSDTWADPVKQYTPNSWLSLSETELQQKIYDYTKDCLQQLKEAGAEPDFIQTGNEINYGMLWGNRSAKTNYTAGSAGQERFMTLLKQAGKACREVCPEAKIVMHSERVAKLSILTNFLKDLKNYSVDYDIIGLSYYPYYHGTLATLNTVLTVLERDYADKKIMIVETGYCAHWAISGDYDLTSDYPISEAGQLKFTEDLITKLKAHPNVIGLYWWWPEANEYGIDWQEAVTPSGWYNATLFDNQNGKAYKALSSLKNFLTDEQLAGVHGVEYEAQKSNSVYNLNGQKVGNNYNGIIIKGGKKMIKH